MAGFGYGAAVLPFAFDLLATTNALGIPDSTNRRKAISDDLPDDPDGAQTIQFLGKAVKQVERLLSNDPSSLGLHPALYFYTSAGAFQPAALFNVLAWVFSLSEKKQIGDFLKVRGRFEQMILDHPVLGKPATHKLGSGTRTRKQMVLLYDQMLGILSSGKSADDAWKEIIADANFAFLATDDLEQAEQKNDGTPGKSFSRGAKSAGYLKAALATVPKCALCGGLLHMNGIVTDHETPKSQGGTSASENGRPVHPRCNSERDIWS